MKPFAAALVCLAAVSAPAFAQSNMITAADPASIADAMQGLGYRAEMDTDGVGDPMIRSAAEGVNYRIYFYGCSDNANCDSLLFSAGFDMDDGMALPAINTWNADSVVARAYLDDEYDPYVQMYVLTGDGAGISAEIFEQAVREWGQTLSDFKETIDW